MTHARLAIAALEKNIHVLSDVPAIHAIEEARPLWDAAAASKAVYMFGATGNYFGFVQTCADLKAKGLLGKPFYLEADYVHDVREFAKTTPWRIGYEPIRYCTHSLGPLLDWLGKELSFVACFGTGSHVARDNPAGHDAMAAIFHAATGEVVKLLVSFTNSRAFGQHRYVCHGTQGVFECVWPLTGEKPKVTFSTREVYGFEKTIEVAVASDRPEFPTLENVAGHGSLDYAMLRDFAAAIGGEPCRLGLKEGLRMTLPGLFALQSAQHDGQLTEIRYPWNLTMRLFATIVLTVMLAVLTGARDASAQPRPNGSMPILVINNVGYAANPFSAYMPEILRAEGLVEFEQTNWSVLASAANPGLLLAQYDVIVTAEADSEFRPGDAASQLRAGGRHAGGQPAGRRAGRRFRHRRVRPADGAIRAVFRDRSHDGGRPGVRPDVAAIPRRGHQLRARRRDRLGLSL